MVTEDREQDPLDFCTLGMFIIGRYAIRCIEELGVHC